MLNKYFLCLLMIVLSACTSIAPQARRQNADTLATAHNWQKLPLPAGDFILIAYVPSAITASETLTVYMEGDGLAWLSPSRPSDDPTPRDPIALKLALQHASGAAAYLARPCQFVEANNARGCITDYWTERRFAPEAIEASNQAIDALKQRFHADRLVLVGYSGGGAIAALVAARRQDVARLVTVAGNLDHVAWTTLHRVSSLEGSLNPADAWRDLQRIPQIHFVGAKDKNISVEVAHAYRARFPADARPPLKIVPNADHACCWADRWPALLDETVTESD